MKLTEDVWERKHSLFTSLIGSHEGQWMTLHLEVRTVSNLDLCLWGAKTNQERGRRLGVEVESESGTAAQRLVWEIITESEEASLASKMGQLCLFFSISGVFSLEVTEAK